MRTSKEENKKTTIERRKIRKDKQKSLLIFENIDKVNPRN
jgi:hypothetical protein